MNKGMWLGLVVAITACAAPPETPTPAATPVARVLGYALPAPATATYAFNDSSAFNIQGGAIGDIKANIGSAGTAEVTYAQKGPDVEATIRVIQLSASMTNSATGSAQTATEKDLEGVAVLTVTPRGAATIVSLPKLSPLIQRVGAGPSFFRRFFSRLPAAAARTGLIWVDTITSVEETGGTKATVHDIVTSTLAGDTTMNGRAFSRVTFSTQRTLEVSGVNEGVQIAQKLSGTSTGRLLWDNDRHLLVDRWEHTELTGTFDLPQMNVSGLPVTARSDSRLTLR